MLKGGYATESVIQALWMQKSRLDHLFDSQLGHDYYDERDAVYPQGTLFFWRTLSYPTYISTSYSFNIFLSM